MFEHHLEDSRLIDKECKAIRYFVHPFTHSPMLEKYPGAELWKAPIVGYVSLAVVLQGSHAVKKKTCKTT